VSAKYNQDYQIKAEEVDRHVASVGDVGYTSLKFRREASTHKTWV
jgi:hypothetical protein